MLASKERVYCFPENIQQEVTSPADERNYEATFAPGGPPFGRAHQVLHKVSFREIYRKLESHFALQGRLNRLQIPGIPLLAHLVTGNQFR